MKQTILICCSLFSIAFLQQEVKAQTATTPQQKIRQRGDSLSPEQKARLAEFRKHRGEHRMSPEKRKELKARYDSLSPEQKKEQREKMRKRFDELSPEQKAQMKERMKHRADSLSPREKKVFKRRIREVKKDTE